MIKLVFQLFHQLVTPSETTSIVVVDISVYKDLANKMEVHNPGMDLDLAWLEKVRIDLPAVKRRASTLGTKRTVKMQWQAAWLCRAVTCIDLTTLSGDDTECNVQRLCLKAAKPIRNDIIEAMDVKDLGLTCGAVCVYPSRYCNTHCTVQGVEITEIYSHTFLAKIS